MRILVIEDKPKVARALEHGLEDEHYEVAISTRGEERFFRLASENVGPGDLPLYEYEIRALEDY